jgi:hypothetical protein
MDSTTPLLWCCASLSLPVMLAVRNGDGPTGNTLATAAIAGVMAAVVAAAAVVTAKALLTDRRFGQADPTKELREKVFAVAAPWEARGGGVAPLCWYLNNRVCTALLCGDEGSAACSAACSAARRVAVGGDEGDEGQQDKLGQERALSARGGRGGGGVGLGASGGAHVEPEAGGLLPWHRDHGSSYRTLCQCVLGQRLGGGEASRSLASKHSLDSTGVQTLDSAGGVRPLLFDVVLVDAPCSSLGTLRRGPNRRWEIEEEWRSAGEDASEKVEASVHKRLASYASLQWQILEGAAEVRIYSTVYYRGYSHTLYIIAAFLHFMLLNIISFSHVVALNFVLTRCRIVFCSHMLSYCCLFCSHVCCLHRWLLLEACWCMPHARLTGARTTR